MLNRIYLLFEVVFCGLRFCKLATGFELVVKSVDQRKNCLSELHSQSQLQFQFQLHVSLISWTMDIRTHAVTTVIEFNSFGMFIKQ